MHQLYELPKTTTFFISTSPLKKTLSKLMPQKWGGEGDKLVDKATKKHPFIQSLLNYGPRLFLRYVMNDKVHNQRTIQYYIYSIVCTMLKATVSSRHKIFRLIQLTFRYIKEYKSQSVVSSCDFSCKFFWRISP